MRSSGRRNLNAESDGGQPSAICFFLHAMIDVSCRISAETQPRLRYSGMAFSAESRVQGRFLFGLNDADFSELRRLRKVVPRRRQNGGAEVALRRVRRWDTRPAAGQKDETVGTGRG
jgi:hypothetical protein